MSLLTIKPLPSDDVHSYDVVLCAVGFEARARNAAERRGIRGKVQFAIGFPDRHVFSYQDNRAWFENAGFEYLELTDAEFNAFVIERVFGSVQNADGVNVAVDISSFNRSRLASILECAARSTDVITSLHLFYSLAEFTLPSTTEDVSNRFVGPVTSGFAGWAEDPMLPPYAVLGLGYEHGKALGAVDHLEISNALAFVPTSPIEQYLEQVLHANSTLLQALGADHTMKYRVHEPIRTFEMLESAVSGLLPGYNPILIPFGPKVFFVISLLVALLHPQCSVWRVSAGEDEAPVDRRPSETIVSFEARFGRK